MAEVVNGEQQEVQAVRKPLSLLELVIVGFVSAGAGFATPFVIPGELVSQETNEQPASQQTTVDFPQPNGEIAFVPFGESVVNLNDGRMSRYLRVDMTLQVDEAQAEQITKLVEERKVILKDWLLRYLSDKDMDAIRGRVGQNRMRREVMDHFNTTLFSDGYDRIHDILFEAFNVQ